MLLYAIVIVPRGKLFQFITSDGNHVEHLEMAVRYFFSELKVSKDTIYADCFRQICEAWIAGYYPLPEEYRYLLVDGALVMCDIDLAKRVLAAFKSLDIRTLKLMRSVFSTGLRIELLQEEQFAIFHLRRSVRRLPP